MPSSSFASVAKGPVDVYASFNPGAEGRQNAEQLWKEHAQDLYRSALTGYGHTALNLSLGVLSYERELQIPPPPVRQS